MAEDIRPFRLYQLKMISGATDVYRARIGLWGEVSPSLFAKVAELHFMRENVGATSAELADDGTIRLFFPSSSLVAVLDILRNEKPLRVHFDPDGPSGWISSNPEPTGEEET